LPATAFLSQPSIRPTVDGTLLQGEPYTLFTAGKYLQGIPLIVGRNLEEGNLFSYLSNKLSINMSEATYYNVANYSLPNSLPNPSEAPIVVSWYHNYTVYGQYFAGMGGILGDLNIVCGVNHASINVAINSTKSFQYLFSHASQSWLWTILNATHTAEVPYVFGNSVFNTTLDQQEVALSNNIIQYFHNFHVTSNPNVPFPTPTIWPHYNAKTRSVINFQVGDSFEIIDDPVPLVCTNWTIIFST